MYLIGLFQFEQRNWSKEIHTCIFKRNKRSWENLPFLRGHLDTKLRSFTCCEKSSNSSTVRRYLASTTPRVLVRTFLELSWLATVWHFSASSTVRTRALRRSVSGYCFSLASSDNSLKSENSRRSSPRASRAFLTYNQNRGHQQFLEDVILHPVQ